MKTIKDIDVVMGLPPKMDKKARIAIDLEIFGMEKKKLHRPTGQFGSLQCYDGKTAYIIFEQNQIQEFLNRINDGVWIFHHAKFDVFHLRRWAIVPPRKRIWDTMLIEQIMFGGFYNGFSLSDVARRWCDIYLPKEERKEFESSASLTDEMIKYAVRDAVATYEVYRKQRKAISSDELNIWKHIEREFLWTLLSMDGTSLDVDAWLEVAQGMRKRADEIQARYDINLNSPKQVLEHLRNLGYKVDSTGKDILKKLAADECDFAVDVLEFRTNSKRASTYGDNFIEKYVEQDGRIYSDIHQMGAETGRTSSRNPNLQNIPRG